MPEHKTDSTGEPLVVHLNPTMLALPRRLVAGRPEGPLFVNNRGNAWTDMAWGKAMAGHRAKLQKASVKRSSTGILYGFRHGFATDLLEKKVPEAHVAALMGHKSTAMLSKHYSHLGSKAQTLKAHLGQITTLPCEVQVGGDDNWPAVPVGTGDGAPEKVAGE